MNSNLFISYDEWEKIHPAKSVKIELNNLISRTIGEKYISYFSFEITDTKSESFVISGSYPVLIKASNGILCAAALGYYYRNYLLVNITEQTKTINIPDVFPSVPKTIVETPYKVRYAFNYCTAGYTFPFFNREEWQKELDFLMLSGVNVILDTGGYEAFWAKYLSNFGYSLEDSKKFIPAAPYQQWWLMDNLEGYGGPVSTSWILDTLEMARERRQLLNTMGISVAEQLYVGMLPNSFSDIAYNKDSVKEYLSFQGEWTGGFARSNILSPLCPDYSSFAKIYYETINYVFGANTHFWCGDVCHEGGKVPDGVTKEVLSKRILDELLNYDKNGIWLIQAWEKNPAKETIDALGTLKNDHLMVLDLCSLSRPLYNNKERWGDEEFGRTPWIYCDLNSFGGKTGIHGNLDKLNNEINNIPKEYPNVKGIGILSEATFQNPITLEIFFNSIWSKNDVKDQVKNYVLSRYGNYENSLKAWDILYKTVYSATTADGTAPLSVYTIYPLITQDYIDGPLYQFPYTKEDLNNALKYLILDLDKLYSNKAYIYDLVDVARQKLIIEGNEFYKEMAKALESYDLANFKLYSNKFISNLLLIGKIAAFNEDETMTKWISRIDSLTNDNLNGDYSKEEVLNLKHNAKAILTVWATYPINYYATRLYTGLIEDLIYPSWKYIIDLSIQELESGKKELTQAIGKELSFKFGWDYSNNDAEPTVHKTDINTLKNLLEIITNQE